MYLQTVRGQCGLQVHAYDTDWPYSPTPMPVGSFRPRSWLKTKNQAQYATGQEPHGVEQKAGLSPPGHQR